MYWQEKTSSTEFIVPADVIDLVFSIRCRSLPVDHAYELSQSLLKALPWLEDERHSAVHTVHVAESGNGWVRPVGPDELLYLSRRTKFTLRLPEHRIEDAKALIGQTLDVGGNQLELNDATIKLLSPITTIFSRYVVVSDSGADESDFLAQCVEELAKLNVKPKKMLCGIKKLIKTPSGHIETRSLMLADLSVDETIALQKHGLGSHRLLGCGIFIPHKDINEISENRG